MATREIKTTIAIDGEKKFEEALKAAQRGLRLMKAELKAETSAFDENTTAQQRAEAKAKSLRTQIEQQRKVVDALRGAVADSAKKWGESSAQADGYRIKLANAQRTLNDMTRELGEAQKASDGLNRSFSETMKAMGPELKNTLSAAGSVISTVGATGAAAFGAVTAAAAGATKGVADMVADTSVQADDLLTLALQTGIDVETLQAWSYAARFIDTEVGSITDSVKKLRVNMQSVDKDTGMNDALRQLGVQAKDGAGRYRDAMDVFWDVIDAAHTNPRKLNETELDTLLQKTMGESYERLLPLISAGRQGWEDAVARAYSSGFVMDQKTVEAFVAYNDLLQQADEAWGSIKNSMAAIALDYATPIASDVSDIATAFNRLLRGEDGAGEDLAGSVETLFADAQTALKTGWSGLNDTIAALEESDSAGAQQLGGALGSLRDGLEDIYEHKDGYIAAIEALFIVMAGEKASEAVKNAFNLARDIGALGKTIASVIVPVMGPIGVTVAAIAGTVAMLDRFSTKDTSPIEITQEDLDNLQRYIDARNRYEESRNNWAFDMDASGKLTNMTEAMEALTSTPGGNLAWEAYSRYLSQMQEQPKVLPDIPEDWGTIVVSVMQEKIDGQELTASPAIAEGWADSAQAAMQSSLNGMRLSVDVSANMTGMGSTLSAGRWVSQIIDGSHANGLDSVPFDGYIAELHKGEKVLTRAEAAQDRAWRSAKAGAAEQAGGVSIRQAAAIMRSALSGVTVQMDREIVGHMLAGIVSEDIAREITEG